MSMDEQLRERIAQLAAEKIARDMRCIMPTRMYSPDDAAELLSIESERRGKTIREIPQKLLPLVPLTPGGRLVGYLGSDLLAYIDAQKRAGRSLRVG